MQQKLKKKDVQIKDLFGFIPKTPENELKYCLNCAL